MGDKMIVIVMIIVMMMKTEWSQWSSVGVVREG
jgi:hypothetical protein